MERWSGRVAVVTGASSGIGAAIAEELVKKGLKVVGLARRQERIQELSKSLKSAKGKLYAVKCDVSKESDVQGAFKWVKDNLGGVDILVNNAAAGYDTSLINGSTEEMKKMLDLNVLGLSVCTKEALQSMKERGVDDGHIIHINSLAGHMPPGEKYAIYYATKHAVTALTEGLRRELVKQNSKIRVTSLSPGLVKTEMPPQAFLDACPYLNAEDIADGVLYVLGTPPHVQVLELIHVVTYYQVSLMWF
ncbi:farnesol dehydrogenase-like [Zootermopsis nevadensis]|uniref:farnesol dehydrogenase-like n=1 Tax=Zootermopsis nevadensis TaxID=136037 RepID=UPI000B8E930D|nr:farnesol dehydrogenase-like [Zootermopsis nevadensis]